MLETSEKSNQVYPKDNFGAAWKRVPPEMITGGFNNSEQLLILKCVFPAFESFRKTGMQVRAQIASVFNGVKISQRILDDVIPEASILGLNQTRKSAPIKGTKEEIFQHLVEVGTDQMGAGGLGGIVRWGRERFLHVLGATHTKVDLHLGDTNLCEVDFKMKILRDSKALERNGFPGEKFVLNDVHSSGVILCDTRIDITREQIDWILQNAQEVSNRPKYDNARRLILRIKIPESDLRNVGPRQSANFFVVFSVERKMDPESPTRNSLFSLKKLKLEPLRYLKESFPEAESLN